MKGKPWTKRDDARLRRSYPHNLARHVAAMLGRGVSAVYMRAHELGIKKAAGSAAAHLAKVRGQAHAARGAKEWTAAQIRQLKKDYATTRSADLAASLGVRPSQLYAKATKLGLKKDPELVRRMAREAMRRPDHGGRAHQFRKGSTPPNKGMKGWQAGGRALATQFKPGQRPHNTKPLLSIRADQDGMLYIKLADTGYPHADWKGLHRLIWEWRNGPIPPKHIVTFDDGNLRNFADDNLKLMSMADNAKRNSIHNLPPLLKDTVMALGRLKRRINREEQNRRPAQPPV